MPIFQREHLATAGRQEDSRQRCCGSEAAHTRHHVGCCWHQDRTRRLPSTARPTHPAHPLHRLLHLQLPSSPLVEPWPAAGKSSSPTCCPPTERCVPGSGCAITRVSTLWYSRDSAPAPPGALLTSQRAAGCTMAVAAARAFDSMLDEPCSSRMQPCFVLGTSGRTEGGPGRAGSAQPWGCRASDPSLPPSEPLSLSGYASPGCSLAHSTWPFCSLSLSTSLSRLCEPSQVLVPQLAPRKSSWRALGVAELATHPAAAACQLAALAPLLAGPTFASSCRLAQHGSAAQHGV